ncbi:MAG: gluconate 2-dehydrogenase subunit 3 family protein [Saprospiraceae bacterium]|nr:gluconate 2-dehydrogenase subunit 3 family protein [Saprospiraceae bacterium]
MKRRDILKYTALMTGAALSTPLILSLESCNAKQPIDSSHNTLHFFTADQMKSLKHMVDAILPKSDSPSGSEVNVHYMIDEMVGTVYSKKDKTDYQVNFHQLEDYLKKEAENSHFYDLAQNQQKVILEKLLATEAETLLGAKSGFLALRQQSIAYYLSTEEVATKHLNYLAVPGTYQGCISLESVGGKAWAI